MIFARCSATGVSAVRRDPSRGGNPGGLFARSFGQTSYTEQRVRRKKTGSVIARASAQKTSNTKVTQKTNSAQRGGKSAAVAPRVSPRIRVNFQGQNHRLRSRAIPNARGPQRTKYLRRFTRIFSCTPCIVVPTRTYTVFAAHPAVHVARARKVTITITWQSH